MSDPSWQQQPDPFSKEPRAGGTPPAPSPYPPYGEPTQAYGQSQGQSQGQPQGQPYGPPYGQPYGAGYPVRPTNGLAIASLVLSCVGLVTTCFYGFGGLLGVVGAIMGHVARGQIRRTGEAGGGLALAGVIVGWTALALVVLFFAILVGVIVIADANYDSY